ncbi:ubiquinone/menaquinone biosynthesis methyltransferase [Thermanaerothrix sp. 4228-RoL]|uniref:Demethylmenaquinone methyltransferase n=1 Tax=Thermanaerothrix solaris TaxID=3058434 RepID=A0ABU3NML6_9CHLR|nr:ubiquinone/menaquinone biosynthesis methyltransferase [Thermanaerothrix sp. 4228-RoL]MDT8898084.1 ubiquinone/menaquinone biosynthesis methyltransferase [Thermanaerothrix sp. 4228-RoL]
MMSNTDPAERAARIRRMFGQIAPRYDLTNRLMTGSFDVRWRREAVHGLHLPREAHVLDLGCGTGDLTREVLRQSPTTHVVAADFTLPMLQLGQRRRFPRPPAWCAADALALPFSNGTFDAVVCAFLLRNVADLDQSLREMARVLKPGGQVAILETTRPTPHPLRPLRDVLMFKMIPWLGGVLTGQRDAYEYLAHSSATFLAAPELAQALAAAGFTEVRFTYKMMGTIAIHWAHT